MYIRGFPNEMFHFGLMPLFMVEHPIIPFNSYHPKGDALEEVPNLGCLSKFLRKSFPKEGLFPIEVVIVAYLNPAKLVHEEGGPLPSMPCLNAIPKLVFN